VLVCHFSANQRKILQRNVLDGERREGREGDGWPSLYNCVRKYSVCTFSEGLAAGGTLGGWVHHCWCTQVADCGTLHLHFYVKEHGKDFFMEFACLWPFVCSCVNSSFENCCEHLGNNVINHNAQRRLLIILTYSPYGFILQKLPQTMNFIKMQMSDLHLLMQLS